MINPANNARSCRLLKRRSTRLFIWSACLLLLSSCASSSGGGLGTLAGVAGTILNQSGGALTADEISLGLKEALSKGSEIVVKQVGQPGGYEKDTDIHIPLPDQLQKARKIAGAVGLDDFFADLETRMNLSLIHI